MVTNNSIRKFLGLLTPIYKNFEIDKVDALDGLPSTSTLMFINKPGIDLKELDENSSKCVYLMNKSYEEYTSDHNDFIRVDNPKFKFCLVVERFKLPSRLQTEFFIEEVNRLRQNLQYHNKLYCDEILIGNRCQIDDGAIIGGIDFSPVLGDNPNQLVQFPQLGGVIIGHDVVVKYHSMIGKGTFGFTRIGDNTMIDYGCQIGHNCIVGKSCIIAAGTIIGGSTVIGDNTVIGIGAKIRNGIKIGKNVSIGMGAVVIRDVPDNCVVVGNPAHIIKHDHIFDEGGLR